MGLETICSQSSANIKRDFPDAEGCDDGDIEQHIRLHMLHPNVKMSLQIRDLSKLSEQAHRCLYVKDEESGEQIINPDMAKLFMTTTRQLQGIYRSGDVAKLMFSQSHSDLLNDLA